MIGFAPFSLDSLFPDFNSWLHDVHERGSQNYPCVSVLPGSRGERLREGRLEWNLHFILQRSCYHRGELAGTEVPRGIWTLLAPPQVVGLHPRGREEKSSSCSVQGAPSYGGNDRVSLVSDLTLFSVLRRSAPTAYIPDLQPHSHPVYELTYKQDSQEEWLF